MDNAGDFILQDVQEVPDDGSATFSFIVVTTFAVILVLQYLPLMIDSIVQFKVNVMTPRKASPPVHYSKEEIRQRREKAFAGSTLEKKTKQKAQIELPEPQRYLPKITLTAPSIPTAPSDFNSINISGGGNLYDDNDFEEEQFANDQNELWLQEALLASTTASTTASSSSSSSSKEEEYSNAAIVLQEGITRFLLVPTAPNVDHAEFLLKKLVREFLPIIQRRGYKVLCVAEMCCCTDGMKAVRGELPNPRGGVKDARLENLSTLGYNRTISVGTSERMHQIYIRLREHDNHYKFIGYKAIAATMAHELAHCIHQNHSPAFYQLMQKIQMEHADLVSSLQSDNPDKTDITVEDQYGFDIYGSSTSRAGFST